MRTTDALLWSVVQARHPKVTALVSREELAQIEKARTQAAASSAQTRQQQSAPSLVPFLTPYRTSHNERKACVLRVCTERAVVFSQKFMVMYALEAVCAGALVTRMLKKHWRVHSRDIYA